MAFETFWRCFSRHSHRKVRSRARPFHVHADFARGACRERLSHASIWWTDWDKRKTQNTPVCGELLIPGRSVIRHTHDQKLDHRAFDYHSPTGPSPRIKFSVPTGLVTPWLQRIFNRHADQLAQVGEAFVRDQREALLLYLVRHEERTPPIMLDRSATVAGLLLCLTAPA